MRMGRGEEMKRDLWRKDFRRQRVLEKGWKAGLKDAES
jgi:hypothetical protein